jgi:hypothetical protein
MKQLFGLLAGLMVLAPAAARADGWCPPGCPPYRIDCGANFHFRIVPLNAPQLAPWYTYWPAEAFEQGQAAAGHFPYWPAQPPYAPGGGPTMHMPTPSPTGGLDIPPSGYQPTGYTQAPSYWYPRQ